MMMTERCVTLDHSEISSRHVKILMVDPTMHGIGEGHYDGKGRLS